MPILDALEGVVKITDYLETTEKEDIDRDSCISLLNCIKKQLVNEIPVVGLESDSYEVGAEFEVLSDIQGVFKTGQVIILSEHCDDGIHYYSNDHLSGYMSKNEVKQVKQ